MPVWDNAVHEANLDQLRFQLAALRLRERRSHRLGVSLVETSLKVFRQSLIDFFGLDLAVPENKRKRDGTGAFIALPLISNSPHMAKELLERARRSVAESDALEDEAKDKYSRDLMSEAMGKDSGDEHAKADAWLASLSLEELARRSYQEGRREEMLQLAGIKTLTVKPEDLDGPNLEWDEAKQADAEALKKKQEAIDTLPSDKLLDDALAGIIGLDPEDL